MISWKKHLPIFNKIKKNQDKEQDNCLPDIFGYLCLWFSFIGALGVMFQYGIGVKCDVQAAFECLKEASAKGNVYAQGNLAMHYYHQKLYNQACQIAKRYTLCIIIIN